MLAEQERLLNQEDERERISLAQKAIDWVRSKNPRPYSCRYPRNPMIYKDVDDFEQRRYNATTLPNELSDELEAAAERARLGRSNDPDDLDRMMRIERLRRGIETIGTI